MFFVCQASAGPILVTVAGPAENTAVHASAVQDIFLPFTRFDGHSFMRGYMAVGTEYLACRSLRCKRFGFGCVA